jgi:hypothetical protein
VNVQAPFFTLIVCAADGGMFGRLKRKEIHENKSG